MADLLELKLEQDYFDRAWEHRERMRRNLTDAPAAAAGPIAQAAQVREAAQRKLAQIAGPNEPIAFGRFNTQDEQFYIGKHAISNEERDILVINWQMPIAEPYYKASYADPLGVMLKRSFTTEGNKVVDFDDIVFADLAAKVAELTEPERWGIDDTVLRDLEVDRTGEMRDIVQTIHAAQYELIRAPLDGVLIVQGGPGTGKTAVALHRVSWLLFNHRSELSSNQVLVVGPNPTFTRYIRSVLPGLGEADVAHRDLRSLGPQPSHRRPEDAETARLKGDERMATLLRAALAQRVRFPERAKEVEVGAGSGAIFDQHEIDAALQRFLPLPTYNMGRGRFRIWLNDESSRRARDASRVTAGAVDAVLERIWPSLTPQSFLRELLGSRDRLLAAAGDRFTAGDVGRLMRPPAERVTEERWSDADVALLDEADELINGFQPEYAHIVVDEAQDLSPMQLRSVCRRSMRRSFTIVGDLAQSTGPWARESWQSIADAVSPDAQVTFRELELGYRVPRQVYEFAALLLPLIAPSLAAPRVVRDGPAGPDLLQVDSEDLAETAVIAAREYAGRGLFVGIVVADDLRESVRDELARHHVRYSDTHDGVLGLSINLASPDDAKGLEFDAVVVVEPQAIADGSTYGLRKLYVALTRTTRYLTVVHTGVALPIGANHRGLTTAEPSVVTHEPVIEAVNAGQESGARTKMIPVHRVANLVSTTVAQSLAQDIREGVPEPLWEAVLGQLRRELGLSATLFDTDG